MVQDAGEGAEAPIPRHRLFQAEPRPQALRVALPAAPAPLHPEARAEEARARAPADVQHVMQARPGGEARPAAVVGAGAQGRVAGEGGVGFEGEALVQRLPPAQAGAGAGDPGAHGLLVQGEAQAAEGGDGDGVALGRVVHVVVAPEAGVEIEPPALPGADAREEAFHGALRRLGQPLRAADLAEDGIGFVVPPEIEEHGGVVEPHMVEVGAFFGEGAEELRGLREMAAGEQGQGGGVAEGARVGAFGRFPQGAPEEGIGRLRLPRHDQVPGGFHRLWTGRQRGARRRPGEQARGNQTKRGDGEPRGDRSMTGSPPCVAGGGVRNGAIASWHRMHQPLLLYERLRELRCHSDE